MTCPKPHAIRGARGSGFAPDLDVLGSFATDTWLRCRLCGAMFWTVVDDGRYGYSAEWELDPTLAPRALVDHDREALAQLFVSANLPLGPVWDFTEALVDLFRALTPGSTDDERARAIQKAGAHPRWSKAALVLSLEAKRPEASELARFPVDLRIEGAHFRDWFEVGDSLVLLTGGAEMLRLEPRGLTRLELAFSPRFLARADDRLMLAVGDTSFLVLDAAGDVSTWQTSHKVIATALDEGWWLLVPDDGNEQRAIELRLPDGAPRVRYKRAFAAGVRWMAPPRRVGDGWIVTNLVDREGATQALSLVDSDFHLVAASAACPPAERRITPIDSASFWATNEGVVELWVNKGATLELAQSFASRASHWQNGQLVTDTREGFVTARGVDGTVRWTWRRDTGGAAYSVPIREGVLFYDDAHAHWLDWGGRLRATFEVESADVRVTMGGTAYVKTLAELWILTDEARPVVVGTDAKLETFCGEDALLRRPDGTVWLVNPAGAVTSFSAKAAWFPVYGTRSGPWLVEGDRIRGSFSHTASSER